jgi:TetR/AcrR family fatty acid metabolism transcriptional regulator
MRSDDRPHASRATGRRGRPRADADGRSRKSDIIRAAVTVFAAQGYHNTRVSDIAQEAGVAHGLVYHYFGSKEQLLEEIFQGTWRQLEQGLASIATTDAPAAQRLGEVVRLMLGSYRLAPDLVRVVVLEVTRSGHLRAQVDEVAQVFGVIEQIIASGQAQGELRSDIDPTLVSYVFWGAIDEVLSGWVFGTLPSDDADVAAAERALVDIVLGGLLPR